MEQFTDNQFESMNVLINSMREEHSRQIEKWGVQTHSLFEWLAYTTEELGELAQAISEYTYRGGSMVDVFNEALETATLSLKIAEMAYKKLVTKNVTSEKPANHFDKLNKKQSKIEGKTC